MVQLDKQRGVAKLVKVAMIDSFRPYNMNFPGLSN
jgi:hypothetical protein